MPKPFPTDLRRDAVAVARHRATSRSPKSPGPSGAQSPAGRAGWLHIADREDDIGPGESAPARPTAGTDLEAENRELRRRTKQLEQANEILRRATPGPGNRSNRIRALRMIFLICRRRPRLSGTAIVVGLVPLIGSIGTFVLAWLAWQQLKELREQARQGREGLASAVTASSAAQQSALEALRSRADENAPRVVMFFLPLDLPPHLDESRGTVQGGQPSLLAGMSRQIASGSTLSDPGDRDKILWYRATGIVVNEGRGTAQIGLDLAMRFISSAKMPGVTSAEVVNPIRVGPGPYAQYLLRPGEAALFEWGAGENVGVWIDSIRENDPAARRLWAHVAVSATDLSVVDHYYTEIILSAMRRDNANASTWIVDESLDPSPSVNQHPPIRIYPAEDDMPPPAPWANV